MPPAIDVQTLRPVSGVEWRWIDTAPDDGVSFGALAMQSYNLLTASDSDEVWYVSRALVDVVPSVSYRSGALSLVADVPLRGEWNDDVGIADPRLGMLMSLGGWGTLRASVVRPLGTLGWPYSWGEERWDFGASFVAGRFAGSASYLRGDAGSVVRGALGVDLRRVRVEVAASQGTVVEGVGLATGEVTVSSPQRAGAWSLAPFVSVGVRPGVGSPSGRIGVSSAWHRPMRVAVPETVPPPALPTPVVEPAPLPPLPPPVVEPAPVPVVPPVVEPPKPVRVRIELHPSCTPRPNEAEIMARVEAQARAFVREKGVGEGGVEVLPAECRPQRGVDLVVVEVR